MGRTRNYQTAARRWAGLGPYYAMFPTSFADRVIREYTSPGDLVLDPFAGRGTSLFSAATLGRIAVGVEINPVGFVYAKTKLHTASHEDVATRLGEIARAARLQRYCDADRGLPAFFRKCFAPSVRPFLLAARDRLEWRRSSVDRTTMAILLVYLHGKEGSALSNQMRQTKAMSPEYSLRWWAKHGATPPEVDPVSFLMSRLKWRYARGAPSVTRSTVYLGDCVSILPHIATQVNRGRFPRARLLFTSPPYYDVTNYHYDQWLRLWLLGGPPHAGQSGLMHRGKFGHRENYAVLLREVFLRARSVLHKDATIYVRTDARRFTRSTTIKALREIFPRKELIVRRRPVSGSTQTSLFGDFERKGGEVDITLTP